MTREISRRTLTTITLTLTKPLSGNQGLFVGFVQPSATERNVSPPFSASLYPSRYPHWFWSNSQCKPVIFLTCRRKYKSCSKFKVYKLPWSRSVIQEAASSVERTRGEVLNTLMTILLSCLRRWWCRLNWNCECDETSIFPSSLQLCLLIPTEGDIMTMLLIETCNI